MIDNDEPGYSNPPLNGGLPVEVLRETEKAVQFQALGTDREFWLPRSNFNFWAKSGEVVYSDWIARQNDLPRTAGYDKTKRGEVPKRQHSAAPLRDLLREVATPWLLSNLAVATLWLTGTRTARATMISRGCESYSWLLTTSRLSRSIPCTPTGSAPCCHAGSRILTD